jgi:DNA helicase HerA-like ATPase
VKERHLSIGRVALGVFLGNVATALLAVLILSVMGELNRQDRVIDEVNSAYNAMSERQAAENLEREADRLEAAAEAEGRAGRR